MNDAAILEVQGVTKRFRGLVAVRRFDMRIKRGAIHSLIGPNGAGKTTLFNVISGIYRPDEGKVLFEGEDITGKRPHSLVARGVARTFQNLRVFPNLTSLENVMSGQHCRGRSGTASSILRLPLQRREERHIQEVAEHWLERTGLWSFRNERAKGLPFGLRKKLELARALATEPKLILLDEPTTGLNNREKEDIMEFIVGLPSLGITILLVEHNMNVVMGISERITVMDMGEKIAEGTPEEIYNDPRVIEAYLGKEETVGGHA
jgi:ABC-type branched-subunit amino acid transport system ATPase component